MVCLESGPLFTDLLYHIRGAIPYIKRQTEDG